MKVSVETTYVQPTINAGDSAIVKMLKHEILKMDKYFETHRSDEHSRGEWWGYKHILDCYTKHNQSLTAEQMETLARAQSEVAKKGDDAQMGMSNSYWAIYDWMVNNQ